jgi:hypothetical protein
MKSFYQKQKGQREPCSHATGYIQGYKLPSYSLAHPIHSKGQKASPSRDPTTTRALTILHSRHWLILIEVLLRCGWHLNLQIMNQVPEVNNLLLSLVELDVLHLDGVLQVHDSMSLVPSTCLLIIAVLSYYYYSRNKFDVEGSHNETRVPLNSYT